MNRYLLDTHILIWLLKKSDHLNKDIRENIEYFQHVYCVSVESIREIVILQSIKKIQLDYDVEKIINSLERMQINIVPIEVRHIKALEKLPILNINGKAHNDPFDRLLIAQTISDRHTIISSDLKFPFYKDYGLKLLVNEK
ncbi:MAG: type II toxin-antitoxin system VapC family toxin [Candidatus Azobacteroides sp.]|nr:type II toxin-antitoxin system VapC family toxin [Candidatus Azobacteroides sp.]